MDGYRLSSKALRDVAEIVSYLHREVSAPAADAAEDRLFTAFRALGNGDAQGHRRADLTPRNLLFHSARPYMVVSEGKKGIVQVLHVVHGYRDLSRLL